MIVSDEKKTRKPLIRRDNGISATSNLINFICGMMGPGCFSVAMSFQQAGLWAGLILMITMGLLSILSMYKIIECSQHLAEKIGDQSLDYGQMAKESCKNSYKFLRKYSLTAQVLVNSCVFCFQLGVLSISLVFAAEHIVEIFDYFCDSSLIISTKSIILLYFLPQLCINLIGNIRYITLFSLFGNLTIFLAISFISKELLFHSHYLSYSLPPITNMKGIVLAAGGLIYSFEGQAMVLPLENKLKYPRDMLGLTGVLTTSMNFIIIIYSFIGFFGYLTFGPNVAGSLTLNLPINLMSTVVKLLLVTKVFLGSALQIFVVVQMIHGPIKKNYSRNSPKLCKALKILIRLLISLVALALAIAIPNLQDIIPFVGITSGMMLSFILPSIIHTIVFLPYSTNILETAYIVLSNLTLFIIGWLFMSIGLYTNLESFTKF